MQEHQISTANLEACLKCDLCTSVCPMVEVNPLYQGPKKSGPDGERYRLKDPAFFDDSLKYCLNCKRCEAICPSGVKVGDIIEIAKLKYGPKDKHNFLRNAVLSHTDMMGRIASCLAPFVNFTLKLPFSGSALSMVGIAPKRKFPSYSPYTFADWYGSKASGLQKTFSRSVYYFHGCYVNYNNPAQGRDLVKILNACGVGVRLLEGEKCCGVALMANGFSSAARSNAIANVNAIRKAGDVVLTTSSSCTYMMRNEYPEVLGVDNSDVRENIALATKWLYEKVSDGELKLAFRKDYSKKIVYHIPCHMQSLGWEIYSIKLLSLIPNITLDVPPQQCCGIAGTFGFKKENYDYSQKIGSRLFESLRIANPQIVATDCETCRWQIEMSTAYVVSHPISILADALDVPATQKLNGI